MAVMQKVVCRQIVGSGWRRVVVVVVAAACETCLSGGGGYGYGYGSDYCRDYWNQETQSSQIVAGIVVRRSNKRIQDSSEQVSVIRLPLEFLNFHCSKSPSTF